MGFVWPEPPIQQREPKTKKPPWRTNAAFDEAGKAD
jgi:hypothetical protein